MTRKIMDKPATTWIFICWNETISWKFIQISDNNLIYRNKMDDHLVQEIDFLYEFIEYILFLWLDEVLCMGKSASNRIVYNFCSNLWDVYFHFVY